ncbi:hypothetical protein D3C85_1489680 [compost metagenome]
MLSTRTSDLLGAGSGLVPEIYILEPRSQPISYRQMRHKHNRRHAAVPGTLPLAPLNDAGPMWHIHAQPESPEYFLPLSDKPSQYTPSGRYVQSIPLLL